MPVMPLYARELGISPLGFGAIISVMGFTRLVTNVPFAVAADRHGRRPLLVGGSSLAALGMGVTGLATSFGELFLSRVLTGAGGGAQQTGAQLYLADIATPKNRARTMAPLGIAFSAGAAFGPAVGGSIGLSYGLGTPFFFVGAMMGCVRLTLECQFYATAV